MVVMSEDKEEPKKPKVPDVSVTTGTIFEGADKEAREPKTKKAAESK